QQQQQQQQQQQMHQQQIQQQQLQQQQIQQQQQHQQQQSIGHRQTRSFTGPQNGGPPVESRQASIKSPQEHRNPNYSSPSIRPPTPSHPASIASHPSRVDPTQHPGQPPEHVYAPSPSTSTMHPFPLQDQQNNMITRLLACVTRIQGLRPSPRLGIRRLAPYSRHWVPAVLFSMASRVVLMVHYPGTPILRDRHMRSSRRGCTEIVYKLSMSIAMDHHLDKPMAKGRLCFTRVLDLDLDLIMRLDREPGLGPRQPRHVRQYSREQILVSPQSPVGQYPPGHNPEHMQNPIMHPDERLMQQQQQQRRAMVSGIPESVERVHPDQEHYRGREHDHAAMERAAYESRALPIDQQQQQQTRVMQGSPGHPVVYQDVAGPDPRFQHHRHPSGPVVVEGAAIPPNMYDEQRERAMQQRLPHDEQQHPSQHPPYPHHDRAEPRRVAPGQQRLQGSSEIDQRPSSHEQRFSVQPPHPDHEQQHPPFVSHEHREAYLHQQLQHHPGAAGGPLNRPPMEEGYPPHRGDPIQHHPDMHRPPFDNPFPGQRQPPSSQAEPVHPPSMSQQVVQDHRHHPGAGVGVPAHQISPQQQGYPPENHPHNLDNRVPYPLQGGQTQGNIADMRRGPDGYIPDDQQQRGRAAGFPPQGPPQNWPARESTPSQGWDPMDPRFREQELGAMHRRVDSVQDYATAAAAAAAGGGAGGSKAPMVDGKGVLKGEYDYPGHGPPPVAAPANMPPNAQMMGRYEHSSPVIGNRARETPPESARSMSPDSVVANSQGGKKRGRKPKGKVGGDYAAASGTHDMNTAYMEGSPGSRTPSLTNDMFLDPQQQQGQKRRSRKLKPEAERETEKRGAHRQWSVITPESHRLSIGHTEAVESGPPPPQQQQQSQPPPMDIKDKGQIVAEQQFRHDASLPMAGRPNDPGMQSGRFPDGGAQSQYGHAHAQHQFPPGSAEEFEHHRRLQLQQQQQQEQEYQRQQQQQLPPQQEQQHGDPYQHSRPPHAYDAQYASQYGHVQGSDAPGLGLESRPEPGYEVHHSGSGRTATGSPIAPVAVTPNKDPETVQHLEAAVANALVNIQHESGFQSPESTTPHLSESEPQKRARLASPARPPPVPMDSFMQHASGPLGHPGSGMVEPEVGAEADLRGRMGARDEPPPAATPATARHRPDLEQDEQETVFILQGMMNQRQTAQQQQQEAERMELEESGLHHPQQHLGHHATELPLGYGARRSPSPQGRYLQQQHPGGYPQRSEHVGMDSRQFDQMTQGHQQHYQQEELQLRQQRHHQQQLPEQHGAPPPPHPAYARGPGYPHNDGLAFDPHHGVSPADEQGGRVRHPSIGELQGQPLHPQESKYDPHMGPASHAPEGQERGMLARPSRSSFDKGLSHQPGMPPAAAVAADEANRWSTDSPSTHGRRGEMAEPSLHHSHRPPPPSHPSHPQQYQSMPPQQQHHQQQPYQRGQWVDPSTGPQTHATPMYQNGVEINPGTLPGATAMGPDPRETGVVGAAPSATSMIKTTKGGKVKSKPRAGLKLSSEYDRADGPLSSTLSPSGPENAYEASHHQHHQQFPTSHEQHRGGSLPSAADDKSMAKPGRNNKTKTKVSSSSTTTVESQHGHGFDGRGDSAAYDFPAGGAGQRRPVKREGSGDRSLQHIPENSSMPMATTFVGSTMMSGRDMAPKSLLFGTGMILVNKLPDGMPSSSPGFGSDSSPRGFRQFPPSQLSIKTARDPGVPGGKDSMSSATMGPGTPGTPSSASSMKKRSRMAWEQGDRESMETTGPNGYNGNSSIRSPQQPQYAPHLGSNRGELSPLSPPPVTTPTKTKSGSGSGGGMGRGRKTSGTAGSTDVDIERSNEITRLATGPAWMKGSLTSSTHSTANGTNGTAPGATTPTSATAPTSSSSSSSSVPTLSSPTTSGYPALVGSMGNSDSATVASSTAGGNDNSAGVWRRPPLPPSKLLVENEKRKPKRIKIEDKDVRQVQRSSSSIADSGDGDKDVKTVGRASGKHTNSNGSSSKRSGAAGSTEEEAADDDEDADGEGEDEVLEEGERESGDVAGSQKRRSPEGDDEDHHGHGDDDTGAAGGGSNGASGSSGNSNGSYTNGQSKGSGGAGAGGAGNAGGNANGRKGMKRKSNSNLAGANSKKVKEKSKGSPGMTSFGATAVSSESANELGSGDDAGDGKVNFGQQRKGSQSQLRSPRKDSSASGAHGSMDSDTEVESLPMEDDVRCPQMFGAEESDREDEADDGIEEDEDEDDDDEDTVKDDSESGTKGAGGFEAVKKATNGSLGKGIEAVEMPDDIQKQGRMWISRLAMPDSAWVESYNTYERVKRLKELKNRQPVRKRDAILAAILYIVCRDRGSPRTFSEICTASGVKRGDIGSYYRLMGKILGSANDSPVGGPNSNAEAYMTRWCESLSLSLEVREAAVHVFKIANTLNLTSGKCPSSVGAAAIYLCIFAWNDARRKANCQRYDCPGCGCLTQQGHPDPTHEQGWIKKEPKDVAVAVGVVSATLMGCFRNLAPEKEKLIPEEFLRAAVEGL
ncbi:Transcription initiation factor IIB, partial [Dissophora globulifera]